MHVTTFYSYKGGVGRSLALMNVAAYLASIGRRVLLVDFDLEAPGLDTFNLPTERSIEKGLVDFVQAFIQTNRSPDVREYVYSVASSSSGEGGLWLMPSGSRDESYARRFFSIDWQGLYRERDGYLLFEDMKAQLEVEYKPDYLFIDSRTGHTDYAGICTRQLPDSVVIFFFPNEQNLRGLKPIVSGIRAEGESRVRHAIQLYFVMSNVPDLDDEHEILAKQIKEFRRELGFKQLHRIYRYNSLALLNQEIFTKVRPTSRLAREYIGLAEAIQRGNVRDREGALAVLEELSKHPARVVPTRSAAEIDDRLKGIENAHPRDPEILSKLGSIRIEQGRYEEALTLLNAAEESKCKLSSVYINRARCYQMLGKEKLALPDLLAALQQSDLEQFHFSFIIRSLRQINPASLARINDLPAVRALQPDSAIWVASLLDSSQPEIQASCRMLESVLQTPGVSEESRLRASDDLGANYISLGEASAAVSTLRASAGEQLTELPMRRLFNYAVAEWALSGRPSKELFGEVVRRDLTNPRPRRDTNYAQCMALAFWAIGDTESARQSLSKARQGALDESIPQYSCWRFMKVPMAEFLEDLSTMQQLIDGVRVKPIFLRTN